MIDKMKMTAYCGLNCADCPTYIATQKDDDKLRNEVAKQWSKQFQMEFKTSDMNCDGCKAENGRLFGYCNACEVRQCNRDKSIETCAECEDYDCAKIQELFKLEPAIKTSLDSIRATLKG
jgi:Protein of unknown function (DUF3795)